MRNFQKIIVVSFLFASTISGTKSEKTVYQNASLDLTNVLENVYNNSPDIKSALHKKRSIDESMAQAISGFYPDIAFQSSYGVQRRKDSNEDYSKRGQFSSIGITYSQNLYGTGSESEMGVAEGNISSAREEFYASQQNILFETIKAYIQLWGSYEILESYKTMAKNLEEVIVSFKARMKEGIVKIQDYESIMSSYLETLSNIKNTEAQIEIFKATLEQYTCQKITAKPVYPEIPKNLPKSANEIFELAQKQNPILLSKKHKISAAENQIDFELSALFPLLYLEGSAGRTSYHKNKYFGHTYSSKNDSAQLGLRLVVPIVTNQGKNGYSNSRKARENLIAAKMLYRQELNNIRQESESLYNNFISAIALIEESNIAVKSAEISLDGYKQEKEFGKKSSTEVVYNENKLVERKIQRIEAKQRYAIAAFQICQLIGMLKPRLLNLNIDSFGVKANEKRVSKAPFKLN